ncbi:MAG: IPT/TIG domain-containing protein [Deltaproteobacteria bacterium]|nr:IPT/TIG domain-containing protein [Deltaproteobacteria bacterium]
MRSRLIMVAFAALSALALVGCGDDDGDSDLPRLDELAPARGVPGECVHVLGVRFGAGGDDGGLRDGGSALVADAGVRLDGGPSRDASTALCFAGEPAPVGGTVSFGGRAARVLGWSDTRIVVVIPGGASGATQVVVNADGRSSNARPFQIE